MSIGYLLDCMGKYKKLLLLIFITTNLALFELQISNDDRTPTNVVSNRLNPYCSIFEKDK